MHHLKISFIVKRKLNKLWSNIEWSFIYSFASFDRRVSRCVILQNQAFFQWIMDLCLSLNILKSFLEDLLLVQNVDIDCYFCENFSCFLANVRRSPLTFKLFLNIKQNIMLFTVNKFFSSYTNNIDSSSFDFLFHLHFYSFELIYLRLSNNQVIII
jgi:hypothetical protein